MERFPSLHDVKVIFEAFPCLHNEKNTFLKHFQVYNIKKHVFEVFASSQHENKCVFEAFSSLQNKKKTRFGSLFKFTKGKTHF